ncbi:M15 family metallopeptidase [Aeromonas australiensis]|uniref:M15 family metallopeptidase n=1 Tax=Aeromonas australiensis TaxID=1114880 RepID=UPI000589CCF2
MTSWPHQSEVDTFYGNPRGRNGEASAKWESENIVRIKTPWKLVTAWDFAPVSSIRVHRRCSESLIAVFEQIWAAAGNDQLKINEWGMNLFAGGYNFRLMRGGTRLSMHSWGCAVDFDSSRNSFGDSTPNFQNIPAVLTAFESQGWTWGGKWKKPDGMHWQAASV